MHVLVSPVSVLLVPCSECRCARSPSLVSIAWLLRARVLLMQRSQPANLTQSVDRAGPQQRTNATPHTQGNRPTKNIKRT